MLIQFSFGNFRSFKENATLGLVAASKLQRDPELDERNVFTARARPKLDLLRVAAIYGANASGKSNLALALLNFRLNVLLSANVDFEWGVEPFLLDVNSEDSPISFEITFIMNHSQRRAASLVLYRYGFEIKQATKGMEIASEWLFEAESSRETLLFERTGDIVTHGRRFTEGKAILTGKRINRAGSLYLSLLAQIGTSTASDIVDYLSSEINVITERNDEDLLNFTIRCLEEKRNEDLLQKLMREADTSIPRVKLADVDSKELQITFPKNIPETLQEQMRGQITSRMRVAAEHPVFNEDGVQVDTASFSLVMKESQGTQKLFAYAGPILDTLQRGSAIVIDEMDARFHPMLTRALIRLFQSSETNPKNAQLVFITHDTNLLDSKSLRRDQIMFVEKDRYGASHLYSLSDFKGIRKGDSFEKEYLEGRYGAIPFLGGLSRLFSDASSADKTPKEASEKTHVKA